MLTDHSQITEITKKNRADKPRCRASYRSRGIEQNRDQPKCRASYISRGIEQNKDQPRCRASYRSRGIEQNRDQPRCRVSYRSKRYLVDGRSTKMQSILQIKQISSRWEINKGAEYPTDQGDTKQMGDQPRCRASYRLGRYQVDGRSTEMQSILQIKEILIKWEINRDAEHPTDQGDTKQMGDQPRCRASYRSRRYQADGRSIKMQSILHITEIQGRLQMMGDNANTVETVDTVETRDLEQIDKRTRMIINRQLY